jgi:DNA processing protein
MEPADRHALVALSIGGLGPGALARRLWADGSVRKVLGSATSSPSPSVAMRILARAGVRPVVPADAEYPEFLLEIDAPPPILFVRGGRLDELAPCVAVVGARVCTGGGARFAIELAASFARAGFTVVSGLARGVDGAAHRGALEEGATIAVLGTGLDHIYPREHASLAKRIESSGALVSEFPPGVSPRSWHFVARNRIISGLALATVVVEAGSSSGALITAGFALEQGREVYACTVAPRTPSGAGVRELLRDGAHLVVDIADTTRELADLAREHGYITDPRERVVARVAKLDGERKLVFDAILEETPADDIVARTGMRPGRVAAVLSGLELDGLVESERGGNWRRTL